MKFWKQKGNERGAVLVEFAMMLPLLVIILTGVVNLGLVIHEHELLQNAAREGARFSAQNPGATVAATQARVVDYMSQENITVGAGDVTVEQAFEVTIDGVTVTASKVTVTYTRPLLLAGTPWLPFSSVQLTGNAVFRNFY
jgi:Flp pilus assembly protein TadG